jgi:hypothetical protein
VYLLGNAGTSLASINDQMNDINDNVKSNGGGNNAPPPQTGLGGKRPELPSIDRTGKVHGDLPNIKDIGKYSKEELGLFLKELKESVQQRIKVTSQLGRDRSHGQRQGAEQDLIQAIEKYLKE